VTVSESRASSPHLKEPRAGRAPRTHANTVRVHDPAELSAVVRALLTRVGELYPSLNTQAAVHEFTGVPEAALSRLLSGATASLSRAMRNHLWTVWKLLPRAELVTWRDRLNACLESLKARELLGAQQLWELSEAYAPELLLEQHDFWLWARDGDSGLEELFGLEAGGSDVWRESQGPTSPWSSFVRYDAYRLLHRLRESNTPAPRSTPGRLASRQSFRQLVVWFSGELRARGFSIEEPRHHPDRTPILLYWFDPEHTDAPKAELRAQLAWRRVLNPLLASRRAPLELSWQEMSDEHLWRYLLHAMQAELVLLERAPNASRAVALGDRPHEYLVDAKARSGRALWDVDQAPPSDDQGARRG